MKGYILDTNALLRYFNDDIPAQTQEVKKIVISAKLGEASLVIPSPVLIETVYVLEKFYHNSRQSIYNSFMMLLKTSYIVIHENMVFIPAFNLYLNSNLSITDAYLISYSRYHHVTLLTFDRKLKHHIL